jgi:two-component system NarL family sensor kinase
MLDALSEAVPPEAQGVMERVLTQHRDTIRALRDLSFNLEPVVLRDQGFGPAVKALTEQVGLEHEIAFHVDVGDAEVLDQKVQAALYQIIRESVQASVRRGPPTRMSITVRRRDDAGFDAELVDNAPGERRRAVFAGLEERARTLNGRFAVHDGTDGGTTVSIRLPPYAAK